MTGAEYVISGGVNQLARVEIPGDRGTLFGELSDVIDNWQAPAPDDGQYPTNLTIVRTVGGYIVMTWQLIEPYLATCCELGMPASLAMDVYGMGLLTGVTDTTAAREVGLAMARHVAAGRLAFPPRTLADHKVWEGAAAMAISVTPPRVAL
jgi:hypothetical protein